MENVLVAFILIFILLFGVLTLADAALSSQDTLQASWQAMDKRLSEQTRTRISSVSAETREIGSTLDLRLHNSGEARLADFDQWDVIVEYYDSNTPAGYHVAWLPYIKNNPAANQWTAAGIYDESGDNEERFEPGVLNPGETLALRLKVSPAVGQGAPVRATLATGGGAQASVIFAGNMLPVLELNAGLTLASGATRPIGNTLLAASDEDDPAAELSFVVTTAPAQGSLSLGDHFTQDDIDQGLLSYTHSGSGPDSFQFSISDGKDLLGPYTFSITISQPPSLDANAALSVVEGGSGSITAALLHASDVDDPAASLEFTVSGAPAQGSLSLGDHFTQDDIDQGRLSYTHRGSGPDSFQFSISDGETTLGPYTFTVSVEVE